MLVVSCQKTSKIALALSTIYYLLFIVLLGGCNSRPLYKDTEVIMGTFVEVLSADKQAAGIVFAEIKKIDALMSKYKEDSEVSRLNRSGKLALSPDTFYVIKRAKEFWRDSEGAFDVTVGPLMDIWGFTEKKYRLPAPEEISAALRSVGMDKIILNETDNVVEFSVSGMEIDLGAIAKGYAVDCAVKKLKEKGIKSCLINAGGQIYCLGDKFGAPWSVAVRSARKSGFSDYLKLKDRAVATSGDYEQYFKNKGRRYSHIFDPKTGYPVDSRIISVTVTASDGLTADALSTSIFVLGKEKGSELIKKFTQAKIEAIEESDV